MDHRELGKKIGYYMGVIFAGTAFVCAMICLTGLTLKFMEWLFF